MAKKMDILLVNVLLKFVCWSVSTLETAKTLHSSYILSLLSETGHMCMFFMRSL